MRANYLYFFRFLRLSTEYERNVCGRAHCSVAPVGFIYRPSLSVRRMRNALFLNPSQFLDPLTWFNSFSELFRSHGTSDSDKKSMRACSNDGSSFLLPLLPTELREADAVDLHCCEGEVTEEVTVAELLPSNSMNSCTGASSVSAPTLANVHAADGFFVEPSTTFIHVLDHFSKAKVSNFIQRMLSSSLAPSCGIPNANRTAMIASCDKTLYEVGIREVQGQFDEERLYHATLRLPLPVMYGIRYAEGFARTEKDAELVAYMHAERIIDALHFPIFQLSSKQKRHAEAARAAGRWAIMPGEDALLSGPLPTSSTPSPPPLQYIEEGMVVKRSRELRVDDIHFVTVTNGVSTTLQHTLASQYFLDLGSVQRLKQFLAAYHTTLQRCCKVTALHEMCSGAKGRRGSHGTGESRRYNSKASFDSSSDIANQRNDAAAETPVFLAQLRLPIAARFGERVCMGKAPTKKEAIALACMHAELTIDALGLALYPLSQERQSAHVVECKKVKRWCGPVGSCDYRYSAVSPPPLQMLGPTAEGVTLASSAAARSPSLRPHTGRDEETQTAASTALHHRVEEEGGHRGATFAGAIGGGRTAATAELHGRETSVETMLVQHSRAVNSFAAVLDVGGVDSSAKVLLAHYLKHCCCKPSNSGDKAHPVSTTLSDSADDVPYLVECLGIKCHETYRATVTVPLCVVRPASVLCDGAEQPHAHGVEEEAAAPDARRDGSAASFVAIGIAPSAEAAEAAAATHALKVLAVLNYPIVFAPHAEVLRTAFSHAVVLESGPGGFPPYNPASGRRGLREVETHPSCMPIRCMGTEHLGRIVAPRLLNERGLDRAPADRAGFGAGMSGGGAPSARTSANRLNHEGGLIQGILQARQSLPIQDWSLKGDTNDRIVVSPEATPEAGRNYVHTLPAVRSPDVFALNRLRDYLERHGKRLETSLIRSSQETDDPAFLTSEFNTPSADDGGRRRLRPTLHVVKVILPVAQRSGSIAGERLWAGASEGVPTAAARVLAHGEGYSDEDALLMCAMHAELLLDALGVPFYDHPMLQRRHADTARMLGRWAPLSTGVRVPPAPFAELPPPLHKAHAASCLWARVQQSQAAVPAASTGVSLGSSQAGAPSPVLQPGVGSAIVPANALNATDPNALATPTDDELCDLNQLQTVHHTDIFRNALKHVRHYFQQRGSDFFRSVRQYTVSTAAHGPVHRAIVSLPLPAMYGKRFAVGCASTKKRAMSLCATHAAWTLDALHIQIYQGRRQAEYAKWAELRGRRASQPGDALKPANTPSPKGLCNLANDVVERPDPPLPPSREQFQKDPRVWVIYVRACNAHIQKNREADLQESFTLGQAPRSGVEVEDEALDAVERLPIDTRAKQQLARACAEANLPRPAPFSYHTYGRVPSKWYLTVAPVLGTPFTARGLGRSGAESIARTAMHYMHLVQNIVAAQRRGGASPTGDRCVLKELPAVCEHTRRCAELFDSVKGDFTPHGRAAVLLLYAATHRPYLPFQLTVRVRLSDRAAASAGPDLIQETPSSGTPQENTKIVALAQMQDNLGLRHVAKGGHPSDALEAQERAVCGLFSLLHRKAAVQSVAQVVKRHLSLRMGTMCVLAEARTDCGVKRLEEAVLPLCRAARAVAAATVFPSALAVLDELRAVPLQSGAGFLSSHHAVALLDAVERRLGQSSTPARLAVPPVLVRDSFPVFGFLHAGATAAVPSDGRDRKARAETALNENGVTPLAAAVALLMQCIPRLPFLQCPCPCPDPRSYLAPTLPLQLGKLLLAGLLFDCIESVVQIAGMVMDLEQTCRTGSESASLWGGQEGEVRAWQSVDVVEAALAQPLASLSSSPSSYETEIFRRLSQLREVLVQRAPSARLTALLARRWASSPRPNDGPQAAILEDRLRMCVAFAVYPQFFTSAPSSSLPSFFAGNEHLYTALESRDGVQRAFILTSKRYPQAPFACFDRVLRGGRHLLEGACSEGSAGAVPRLKDCVVGHGVAEQERVCVAGTSMPPLLSIVATVVGSNEPHVLAVEEDVPNLILMAGGTVPVAFPSVALTGAVHELQHTVAAYLSCLMPLPTEAMEGLQVILQQRWEVVPQPGRTARNASLGGH